MSSDEQHEGWPRLSVRRRNVLLGALLGIAVLSGVASFALPDDVNGAAVVAHGVAGLAVAVLAPGKATGSVRTGLRRGRRSRWMSLLFAAVVVGALLLGVAHASGLWRGIGPWSALWTHVLLGVVAVPLLAWHAIARRARPRRTDLSRRGLLQAGAVLGAGGLLLGAGELVVAALGLPGARRRHTGSYEVASRDPNALPAVIWLTDRVPADTAPAGWDLRVQGRPVSIARLRAMAVPTPAVLDCTGGWWSEQLWDAVPLSALVEAPRGRSVLVRSVTGHARRFSPDTLSSVHLAVGYSGRPLADRHGGPVRLVAPGWRGPWWVKWVATVEDDDRPPWLELPLPVS